jgi:hypothetical protein
VFNTPKTILVFTECLVLGRMPNKRHPTRKYIGFWGTSFLKQKLLMVATQKKITLSRLITKVLWKHLEKYKLLVLFFYDL